ncbi:FAD-dependent oxidoreductase, partial [Rhizobium johnstonii]
VLVGVGRVPNTQGLGLTNAGIKTDQRGFILVDDHLRVQGKNHIWAMGDVAGSPMFTYISLDDYRIVREQLFGDGKRNRADRTPF